MKMRMRSMEAAMVVMVVFAIGAVTGTAVHSCRVETPEGYETVSCRLLELRGDTVITINKMVKAGEE